MSGGHWNYLGFKIEERVHWTSEALDLLAAIEHDMDWALSGDTCEDCARLLVWARLAAIFAAWSGDGAEDWRTVKAEDNECPRCKPLPRTGCKARSWRKLYTSEQTLRHERR